jgi:hypothetical protein
MIRSYALWSKCYQTTPLLTLLSWSSCYYSQLSSVQSPCITLSWIFFAVMNIFWILCMSSPIVQRMAAITLSWVQSPCISYCTICNQLSCSSLHLSQYHWHCLYRLQLSCTWFSQCACTRQSTTQRTCILMHEIGGFKKLLHPQLVKILARF